MSRVWTNTVNCTELCDGPVRQASIFLAGAWQGTTNTLTLLDPSIVAHVNAMLDLYGTVTVVVLWYFNEMSPADIESTLNVNLTGVYCYVWNLNWELVDYFLIDNTLVQSCLTFKKFVPEESISDFSLEIVLEEGFGPTYEYPGAFYDIRLYAGEYIPFLVSSEIDPNIPAGLAPGVTLETPIALNPLLAWNE